MLKIYAFRTKLHRSYFHLFSHSSNVSFLSFHFQYKTRNYSLSVVFDESVERHECCMQYNIIFGISFRKLVQPIRLHECHTVNVNKMKWNEMTENKRVRICNFITHYRQTRQSRQFPFASFDDWNCSIDRRQLMPNGWFYLIQFSCSHIWIKCTQMLGVLLRFHDEKQ